MARRKTARKAGFHEFDFCWDANDSLKGKWANLLPGDSPLILELGCGRAEWLMEMAQKDPGQPFVGVDLKRDRMWHAATAAQAAGLPNVGFLHLHIEKLHEYFEPGEVGGIWVTFPDPFPKKRYEKHRLLHPRYLAIYQYLLQQGKKLWFKTDNLDLFHYALEQIVRFPGAVLDEVSFDLHTDERVADIAKIETTYERKFRAEGLKINYLSLHFHTNP